VNRRHGAKTPKLHSLQLSFRRILLQHERCFLFAVTGNQRRGSLEVGEGARTKYSCIATPNLQKPKRGRYTGHKKWYWMPLPVVFGTVGAHRVTAHPQQSFPYLICFQKFNRNASNGESLSPVSSFLIDLPNINSAILHVFHISTIKILTYSKQKLPTQLASMQKT
jgi:hypothetical protein